VLVAALLVEHPNHSRAFPELELARRGEVQGYLSTHTLAELYILADRLERESVFEKGKRFKRDRLWNYLLRGAMFSTEARLRLFGCNAIAILPEGTAISSGSSSQFWVFQTCMA